MIFISILLVFAFTKINEKLEECRQSAAEVDDDHDHDVPPEMTDDDISTATAEEGADVTNVDDHLFKYGEAGVRRYDPIVDTLLLKKTMRVPPKLPQSHVGVRRQNGCFPHFRLIPAVGPAMQRIEA
jgi:hypothetical protein